MAASVLWAVALLVSACGSQEPNVGRYCAYGAVSEAQLVGCIRRVERVPDTSTRAARYGRYEIDECLADAGPFCGDQDAINNAYDEAELQDQDEALEEFCMEDPDHPVCQ